MSQINLIDAPLDPRRLKAYGAYWTPPSVVFQGLAWLRQTMKVRAPRYCLDPCAGAGVFGMVGRLVWPESRWTAVEPRDEELEHLNRWYDDVHPTTLGRAIGEDFGGDGPTHGITRMHEAWDLIVTNPPFALAAQIVDWLVPALWAEGGTLALYLPTQWCQEERGGLAVVQKYTPAAVARIAGRVQHMSKSGTDRIGYAWFVWTRSPAPFWRGFQLPELPRDQLRWRTRPGTQTPEELDLLKKAWRAGDRTRDKTRAARRR